LRAAGRCAPWGICPLLAALILLGDAVAGWGQVDLPRPGANLAVSITAERAHRWRQGAYEVWMLEGACRIEQGTPLAESESAVLWIERDCGEPGGRHKVIAYLEGNVTIRSGDGHRPGRLTTPSWLGRFYTDVSVRVTAGSVGSEPHPQPPLVGRAWARREKRVRRLVVRGQAAEEPTPAAGVRRIRLFRRSNVPVQAKWTVDPRTKQAVAQIDSGVNLIVEGLGSLEAGPIEVTSIDVSTDRLVIWTEDILDRVEGGQAVQAKDVPLEIYMEGNVVFRQGDAVIYADRMYYDVNRRIGVVLDAELLTPVPEYEGLLRLKAQILQQTGPHRFFAQNAFITSSRMGHPGYRIETQNATFEDTVRPVFNPFTGTVARDPETDEPIVEHEYLATGRNNFLYLGQIPILWWPFLATDLKDPSFYISRVRVKNDNVFGSQLLTDWDAYQVLGLRNPPEGTDWDFSIDYLNDRGVGHGTTFSYGREGFLGMAGMAAGLADFWAIQDRGRDNLGRGRRSLQPEKDYRYRLFWQHRQELANDFQLSAEIGWISDRNFLEQYYEREWDELKDQSTGLELKRTHDNISWSITADKRINRFFTQTEWLPRLDHFWLGQSLFGDRVTWYEHSSAGYARLRTASTPDNAADLALFKYLPWESLAPASPLSVQGERFATRQELDVPVQLGPVKVVPYVLGEFAHWGEDRLGDSLQRFYGQTGVRASLPMWNVDPTVRNDLFNLKGLAHKVVFDVEASFAESNRDLTLLPLYDPLDDDSVEAFRRRFAVTAFGGAIPARFDERFYALRSGLAGWVTSPATEIAGDLLAIRLGMRHRWQTKRGMPGNERILDWLTLDTNATVFPKENRDNFGQAVGLVDYDLRWHVGDRLTLLSSGMFDFFDSAPRLVSVGGFLNRPPRGNLYLGMHWLDGPVSSSILSLSYSYQISPKWVSSFGMSVDFAGDGNIGQQFSFTRVGESLLVSAGFNVDASRNNVGVHLAIEPRFLPKKRLGRATGARIPVAGTEGLE